MTFPEGVQTVTVTGKYLSPSAEPHKGTVEFIPYTVSNRVSFPDFDFILRGDVPIELDRDGAFSVNLVTTDTPGSQPEDWTYQAVVRLSGQPTIRFNFKLPASPSQVDMADITPVAVNPPVAVLQGPRGPKGDPGPSGAPAGPRWYYEHGVPESVPAGASPGDFYMDLDTGYIYRLD